LSSRLVIRTARWCSDHPLRTVACWLALAAAVPLAAVVTGAPLMTSPGSAIDWSTGLGLAAAFALLAAVLCSVRAGAIGALMLSSVALAGFGLLGLGAGRLPTTGLTCSVLVLAGLLTSANSVLFAVRRHQEARAEGHGRVNAIQIVASTAGRASLVSGCTVLASMIGLWLVAGPTLKAVAVGIFLFVALATAAALTLLPALLAVGGVPPRRVLRWELPLPMLRERRFHPMPGAAAATAVLAALVVSGAFHLMTAFNGVLVNLLVMLGFGAVVLMVAFRPPMVAVATVVLGLLSPLAMLGVISWLPWHLPSGAPMVLLAVLLVPSTDVHVLLLQRFRSESLAGMSTHNIVACGVRNSAGTLTGSVLLASGALLAFGLVTSGEWHVLGLCAAVAVVVDTVLVRVLVLPVVLQVTKGGLSWWRPRVLVLNQAV
jgi:uncharacterized membrane protein YdfJ with MMPL/SSD domain